MRVAPLPDGHARWDAVGVPGELRELRTRLRARVVARIGEDGAIREPCHSRVLESALGLRMLRRVGGHPDAERRLARYLEPHCRGADPIDRLLARTALGHSTIAQDPELDCFLERVPEFTSARKRATLIALLHALGATADAREHTFLPDPAQHGLHSWAQAQTAAVKVILAVAGGRPQQVTATDLALLRDTQTRPDVWEGNLLVHLSALHALALAEPSDRVVAAGVRKVLRHQRPDGGLPFVTDVDTWCTATGALALASIGAPPTLLHLLAQHLVTQQHPDGGWSFSDNVVLCDTDDVSVALEFLTQLDAARYRDAVKRGFAWLYRVQNDDGGFPTYPGAPSEPCMSVAAVNALTSSPRSRSATSRAVRYVHSHQDSSGMFPPDWSASRFHTLFRASLAGTHPVTASLPPAPAMAARAIAAVLESQNPDGGWGQQPGMRSDPTSTAYALIAVTRQHDPTPAADGLTYLLATLDRGGAAIADSIGPRPFTFTVPALADIFSLLAVGHLTAAYATAPGAADVAAGAELRSA